MHWSSDMKDHDQHEVSLRYIVELAELESIDGGVLPHCQPMFPPPISCGDIPFPTPDFDT